MTQGAPIPRTMPDAPTSTDGMVPGLLIVAALVAVTLLVLWLVDRRGRR